MLRPSKQFLAAVAIATLWFALAPTVVWADDLKPFTSDGCSSFPNGTLWQQELWLRCCSAHDLAYWQGGTYQKRLSADLELQQCVAEVGEEAVAVVMLAGVRVGGTPFLPTSFRWGYGWGYPRFYGELTELELGRVKTMLPQTQSQ